MQNVVTRCLKCSWRVGVGGGGGMAEKDRDRGGVDCQELIDRRR